MPGPLAHLGRLFADVLCRQKDLEDVFKTNFHGPLNITRALLPKLRARGTGTLLFMSSQAGWQ